jgi:DNA-binding transcriptional regulator YiaG
MNGDEVRRRRNALGISQDGLARLLGVTRQTVYSWERGLRVPPAMLNLALRWIEYEQAIERDAATAAPAGEDGA